jgi:hypothetical protein
MKQAQIWGAKSLTNLETVTWYQTFPHATVAYYGTDSRNSSQWYVTWDGYPGSFPSPHMTVLLDKETERIMRIEYFTF